MHPLLATHLRRHLPDADIHAEPWRSFLAAVDETYQRLDLLHAFPDVLLHLDATGVVTAAVGAVGSPPDSTAWGRRRLTEVLSPAVGATFDDALRRTIFGQAVTTLEFATQEGTGARHYEIRLAPVGPATAIAIIRDVSARRTEDEQRLARNAAAAAIDARRTFLANMSHELRTPLNAIIGYSEMLTEEAHDSGLDTFIADLGRISQAGRHLLQIVNTILDVARLEAGQVEVQAERVHVDLLVREVAAAYRPAAAERNNRLDVRTRPDLPVIITDPAKLRQILTHLVGNACKFTDHGQIVVETSVDPSGDAPWLQIAVRDTGIGIPGDQVSRLFQDFVQLDASNTRKYGGAGLGLSMSRRLCDLLGGTIDVTSTPGIGSTFTVRLPADTAARPPAPGHTHADSPAPSPVSSPS